MTDNVINLADYRRPANEIPLNLNDDQVGQLVLAAARAGLSVDQFVTERLLAFLEAHKQE